MANYRLIEGLYLYPTPAGAYYAISSSEANQSRQFLQRLLQQSQSPKLTLANVQQLTQIKEDKRALALLHHCQKQGWIEGLNQAKRLPQGHIDQLLAKFLQKLSRSGQALLADDQGFYLAQIGFADEIVEELSALSAELANLQRRRADRVINQLGMKSYVWSVVNVGDKSQIGFWPIFIGQHRFVMVISGLPHFNQAEFVLLVWMLSIRYAD